MLPHTLIVASLGLAAGAIMIPSTMSLPDFKFGTEGHTLAALSPPGDMAERFKVLHMRFDLLSQIIEYQDVPITVALSCGECATTISGVGAIPRQDPTFLEFQIDISPDGKSLDMNSIPIFPIRAQPETASALAITKGSEYHHQQGRLEYTAGSFIADSAEIPKSQLVDVYIQITSFDDIPVNVEAFSVRMLRDSMGRYHLRQVIVRSSEALGNSLPPHNRKVPYESALDRKVETECSAMTALASNLCRLRVKLNEQVSSWQFKQPSFLKYYGSRKPCGSRFNKPGDLEGIRRLPLRGGPAKYAGKFHGGRFESHHRTSRFMHIAATTVNFVFWDILIPIMIGAVACVTASLLGMIVGTLIAATWLRVVRGGKRGNASSRHEAHEIVDIADQDSIIAEREKEGLLEQAPAYEESEALPKYVDKE